jgi:hypothetical protein
MNATSQTVPDTRSSPQQAAGFRRFMTSVGHFAEIIRQMAAERNAHNALVPHPLGGPRFEREVRQWHLNEINALLTEINRIRRECQKGAITFETLAIRESFATGHYDYAWKLAISCARLAQE